MSDYMADWETWMRLADPAIFRYEDLLTDYYQQAERLVNFLDLDLQSQKIRNTIEKNKPRDAAQKTGSHFSKGKIGRFRDVLTPEQIALCEERFSPYLEKMGYEL